MRKRYKDPEERLKLSLKLRGENSPNYGKTVPDECRKRISESLKGKKNPNYGKPAHNRGKKPSPETLEKRSLGIKKAWARRKLEIVKNSQIPTLAPVSLEGTQIPQY